MAEANEKMAYTVTFTFDTETEGKSLTKTFSDYNTSVSDDALRTVGKTINAQALFASNEYGVISGLTKIERHENKTVDVPVDAA